MCVRVCVCVHVRQRRCISAVYLPALPLSESHSHSSTLSLPLRWESEARAVGVVQEKMGLLARGPRVGDTEDTAAVTNSFHIPRFKRQLTDAPSPLDLGIVQGTKGNDVQYHSSVVSVRGCVCCFYVSVCVMAVVEGTTSSSRLFFMIFFF